MRNNILYYLNLAAFYRTLASEYATLAKWAVDKGHDYLAMDYDKKYSEMCAKSTYYINETRKERKKYGYQF